MIRSKILAFSLILATGLSACGPGNSLIVTVPPETSVSALATPPAPLATAEASIEPTPAAWEETPLPPLEVAPPEAGLPPVETWDGLPTYLAESAPDTYFRVNYNPYVWDKTEDQFGQIVLAHRQIPYCVITPIAGRGLPMSFDTEREMRAIGPIEYEINLTYKDGVLKFASYYGGISGELYTGFQVSVPEEQGEACLQDAEAVLATLRPALLAEATPGS